MRYLLLFVFMIASLKAAPKMGLEADYADYDGKRIHMLGSVFIQHEFGDIRCDRGEMLMKDTPDKGLDPDRIKLYGSVEVILKDGSILTSDEADIACDTLIGIFTAEAPQKVVYITRVEDAGRTVPVKTMSRAMKVTMKRESTEYVIDDIQAEGAVNIEYQVGE